MIRLLTFFLALAAIAPARPVLVISIDGMDNRYLTGADAMSLKIPHLRKLMREGRWAERGVEGVVPTVTWPSHTTLISGVAPSRHGILGNRRPASDGGDYYWSANLLKARTLLDELDRRRMKSAAITWPVTVDAPVHYNLPEYFQKRRGGSMDLPSIGSKAVPANLVQKITEMFPSFPQEWMDDRTRSLAVRYLVKAHKPDLLLVHFVDLDSEAHDNGPFSKAANAILELTDEYLGQILRDLPSDYGVVIVSDHGFERIERQIAIGRAAERAGVPGVDGRGGIVTAATAAAADWLRAGGREFGAGREIPREEVVRFDARLAAPAAVFEPAAGVWFDNPATGEIIRPAHESGSHGHWPSRYRAAYVAWGPGIRAERIGELKMTDIVRHLASYLGISFEPGPRAGVQ